MKTQQALELTDVNFEQEVLKSDEPVLVDFWAPWCGPCRTVGPLIEDLAPAYDGKVKVGKVNVDENPNTASRYGIMSIPSILLFKNGEVVDTLVGVQSRETYEKAMDKVAS